MKSKNGVKRIIAGMPKAELHLHLEGAIPDKTLLRLILKSGKEPSIRSVTDLRERLVYSDFTGFIRTWVWKNSFITAEKDFEGITYDVLKDLHRQNVRYVELTYSPSDYWRQALSVDGITEQVVHGKERAYRDFGINSGLILDLVRDDGPEKGKRLLDQLTPYLGRGIVGITIGGSEQKFPPVPYAGVYREARARGFRLTAHAGEAAGADSIRACIEKLGVERIGHGLRAHEDPELVSLLAQRQVPLEVCVTSNVKTQVCDSLAAHPIKEYFQQGLMVTVNSDDPSMFGSSITEEYLTLVENLAFSAADIRRLILNSVAASFLPDTEKRTMMSQFEQEWVLLSHKYGLRSINE